MESRQTPAEAASFVAPRAAEKPAPKKELPEPFASQERFLVQFDARKTAFRPRTR